MRRVVVTGLGTVNPLGRSVPQTMRNIYQGKSGITKIEFNGFENMPCKIGGNIPNKSDLEKTKEQSYFILYSLMACEEALKMSGWNPIDDFECERTGVSIGTGIGGVDEIYDATLQSQTNYRKVSPYFIPKILPNMASAHICMKYGFKGPCFSCSTACATGNHSIIDGYRSIVLDESDVMVVGASEASITPLSYIGFCRSKSLTTKFNDNPSEGSRPFDNKRCGFVMGEGSGILIIEEYQHALRRGAEIQAEILGYGLSNDAYHITQPNTHGSILSMKKALKSSKITPNKVDYINCHATSTLIGDKNEIDAINSLFGGSCHHILASSNKGNIGHLLGAAGAVESVISICCLNDNLLPGTLNLGITDTNSEVELLRTTSDKQVNILLKNSFGFGGVNSTLVFKKL